MSLKIFASSSALLLFVVAAVSAEPLSIRPTYQQSTVGTYGVQQPNVLQGAEPQQMLVEKPDRIPTETIQYQIVPLLFRRQDDAIIAAAAPPRTEAPTTTTTTTTTTTKAPAKKPAAAKGPYYLDMLPSPIDGTQATRIMNGAVAGITYPAYATIPTTTFSCEQIAEKQGFYADPETRCQVYRRCAPDGTMTSYLCSNGTIFNQVTLTCDWFWNVECEKAALQYDYSNSRLSEPDAQFLDSPPKGYQPAWMGKWIQQTLQHR